MLSGCCRSIKVAMQGLWLITEINNHDQAFTAFHDRVCHVRGPLHALTG